MDRTARACRGLVPAVAALALAGALGGCAGGGPELPQTYPVRGRVTYPGGEPVPGGQVHFQPESDTTVTTNGEIGPDGSFVLRTYRGRREAPGALAGPHRVLVTPAAGADQVAQPAALPKPYTVEARDNEFHLVIEKPRR